MDTGDGGGARVLTLKERMALLQKSSKERPKPGSTSSGDPGGACTPCDNYRVDVLAVKFGTCKCGFLKSEHTWRQRLQSRQLRHRLQSAEAWMVHLNVDHERETWRTNLVREYREGFLVDSKFQE